MTEFEPIKKEIRRAYVWGVFGGIVSGWTLLSALITFVSGRYWPAVGLLALTFFNLLMTYLHYPFRGMR